MSTIVVKNQAELDALPDSFSDWTIIEIRAVDKIIIPKNRINACYQLRESSHAVLRGSSHAELWESSHAELWESSHAVLRGSSHAVLWGSSHAELWESSHAVLRGSSHAELWESSHAELWESSHAVLRGSSHAELWESSHAVLRESSHAVLRGSSHAVLWGSSHAELWESSHAVLWESSHAELWESSHAELRESSHAVLWENSVSQIWSPNVKIETAKDQSVLIFEDGLKPQNISRKGKGVQVLKRKPLPQTKHTLKTFKECFPKNVDGNFMFLYKSVNPQTGCDFYTGEIKYEGTVECPDFDPNPEIECGKGLHLSPTMGQALSYNVGKLLKCRVKLEDIVVYPHNITKVRCRRVEVLGAA